jgi:hypothetical protein
LRPGAKAAIKKEVAIKREVAKGLPVASLVKKHKAPPQAPKAAGVPPREAKDPRLIKADVKKRKVEAFAKNLLDEWISLVEGRQLEAWNSVITKFKNRVPGKYLALMANKLGDGLDPADFDAAIELANAEAEHTGAAKEEDSAQDTQAAEAEAAYIENFAEVMPTVLEALSSKDPKEWNAVWSDLKVDAKRLEEALTAFLQAAAESGEPEQVAKFLQQLAVAKLITPVALQAALADTGANLEDLTQTNDTAWHLHSRILMMFFPKTQHSAWGFSQQGWTWSTWWQLTEKALASADKFRAFDILVLVLQMMQEASGVVVKSQQAWKESGRIATIRKVLCNWGDMDEPAILETLAAYGVEL